MRAGKNVWCDGLVAIHGCRSMKLQQICLRTWYHSIRHVFFENQRENLLDRYLSIRHANLKIHACWSSETTSLCCCSCNKYVFWPSVTSTNTTDVQKCLLVEWCSRWVLAGPLPLNQYACRSFTTQSVCLPIFYHSFLHACWCYVSLFDIPACTVSHYQPCLLVWSLTIGHAFWCDASLSAMPSGVLSHHRPRLLVWSLIINHDHYCGASL